MALQKPLPRQVRAARRSWTGGTIVTLVLGIFVMAAGIGAVPAGAVAMGFDQAGRDSRGFISTQSAHLSTTTYAIRSEGGLLRIDAPDRFISKLLGDVRIEGSSTATAPLFVGIATSDDATAYLAPIEHVIAADSSGNPSSTSYQPHSGSAPSALPSEQKIWVASTNGTGTRSAIWPVGAGDWTMVVMNADGTRPVDADVKVAATLPWLNTLAVWLLVIGLLALTGGALLVSSAFRRSSAQRRSHAVDPGVS
jgi:hypothetical protein